MTCLALKKRPFPSKMRVRRPELADQVDPLVRIGVAGFVIVRKVQPQRLVFRLVPARDDVPNIQCSQRKLIGAGLVLRRGAGRSGVSSEVTAEGRRVTDDCGALRRRRLIQAVANVPGFSDRLAEAMRTLNLLSGTYEEISCVAATHRRG